MAKTEKSDGGAAKPKAAKPKTTNPKTAAGGDVRTLKITLVRSPIGFDRTQATTVTGMGLRRIGHSVELRDTPATRGMILKVRHLVTVGEQTEKSVDR